METFKLEPARPEAEGKTEEDVAKVFRDNSKILVNFDPIK